MTTDPKTTLTISGPVDLISGIPYLLGFHPDNSLVLVGLAHGALVVTTRADLDGLTMPVLAPTIDAMIRGGARDFIAAIYTDANPEAHRPTIDDLIRALADLDVLLLDALHVNGNGWASYLCTDPTCCPTQPRPLPQAPTPFQAAATVAGMTAAPSRDALADRLAPAPGRDRLLEPLTTAQDRLNPMVVNGSLSLPARIHVAALLAALDTTIQHDLASVANTVLSGNTLIDLAAALRLIPIRDAIWVAVDERHGLGAELWQELARRLPSPYDATPLFLYAWTMWRQGNGAIASLAARRAVISDPPYSAAELLLAALSSGIDPRQVPPLTTYR